MHAVSANQIADILMTRYIALRAITQGDFVK